MPINSVHPELKEVLKKIELTEDAFQAEVVEYVPHLYGESPRDFHNRVSRGSFYNVTERTVQAMIGALMRKPYTLDGQEPETDLNSFEEFIQDSYRSLLLQGRIGILVDFDETASVPKLVTYSSEQIINWCRDFIILKESLIVHDEKDKYELKEVDVWRELTFDENGFYTVNMWRRVGKESENKFEIYDTITPTVRGTRISELPFVFCNPYNNTEELYLPPLYAIAETNVKHFRLNIDQYHALHFTALPTPYIAGDLIKTSTDPNSLSEPEIHLGSDRVIRLTQGSSVGFLEFNGAGVKAIADEQAHLEQRMYSMGAKMLSPKKGVESADALEIRSGSESAILETLTNSLESALNMAFQFVAMWTGATPNITLNKDFTAASLSSQDIAALLSLYSNSVITLDTLVRQLYQGEIVSDIQAELEKLTVPNTAAPSASNPQTLA